LLIRKTRRAGVFLGAVSAMLVASVFGTDVQAQINVALGKLAVTSSVQDNNHAGYGAHLAVDGNTNTRWSSASSDPTWYYIDLGNLTVISRVVLHWEVASGRDYVIEGSNSSNFATKTTLATRTYMATGSRVDDITGLSGSFRYIRVYGTARTTSYGYSLFEFEVYNDMNPSKWLSGSVVPAASLGNNGDYYLNTVSADVYSKSSDAWSLTTNIRGVSGVAGLQGPIGPAGATGLRGPAGTPAPGNALGDMQYWDGTQWTMIPRGSAGQVLTAGPMIEPSWSNPAPSTVIDVDGNVYHTVVIGTQMWTVENLKTTSYNDGTPITYAPGSAAWLALTDGGYCWYNNVASTSYGALYNWYALNTGKLAPIGWHVPTNEDWIVLTDYLGGTLVAGGKMKAAGIARWQAPNAQASNSSGFSAFPNGYRALDGLFVDQNYFGSWWSATENPPQSAFYVDLLTGHGQAIIGDVSNKLWGLSVRLVRDN
jgi:uncharacterized protein (TIGR02145 family)